MDDANLEQELIEKCRIKDGIGYSHSEDRYRCWCIGVFGPTTVYTDKESLLHHWKLRGGVAKHLADSAYGKKDEVSTEEMAEMWQSMLSDYMQTPIMDPRKIGEANFSWSIHDDWSFKPTADPADFFRGPVDWLTEPTVTAPMKITYTTNTTG